MPVIAIETSSGIARANLLAPEGPDVRAALVLGHGAGGGVTAPDLQVAGKAARSQGYTVVLVEQPYRVAGRRAPPPAPRLDAAWIDVLAQLRSRELAGMAIVAGGRSAGARVACRTAPATGAIGVLCLAFPLLAPQRAGTSNPPSSRLFELDAVPLPVLVVQGAADRFGMPPPGTSRIVVQVAGDHALKRDLAAVGDAVADWLFVLAHSRPDGVGTGPGQAGAGG